jgi:hypothetical protein
VNELSYSVISRAFLKRFIEKNEEVMSRDSEGGLLPNGALTKDQWYFVLCEFSREALLLSMLDFQKKVIDPVLKTIRPEEFFREDHEFFACKSDMIVHRERYLNYDIRLIAAFDWVVNKIILRINMKFREEKACTNVPQSLYAVP